jgi:hypothetical protein
MAITICGYSFEGPHQNTSKLLDRSGVYAILTQRADGRYDLLDAGESARVRTRVENHDREACWFRHSQHGVFYAAYYTDGAQQAGRQVIEQLLRNRYNPPCGKR